LSVPRRSEINGNFCGRRDVTAQTTGLGGGVFSVISRVTIDHSAVEGNQTPYGDGGGIYHAFNGLRLEHATVNGNTAAGDGGGIWNGGVLLSNGGIIAKNAAGGARG